MRSILLMGLLTALAWGQELPKPEGTWQIAHTDGKPIVLELKADHSATSDWGTGEVGTWLVLDAKLYLDWTDGWRDVIFWQDGQLVKWAWGPGVERTGPPTNKTSARKLDDSPSH